MRIKQALAALAEGAARFDENTGPSGVDRSKYVGSSELGGCIRASWYAKHDTPREEGGLGYARRGHVVERYMVEALTLAGLPLKHAGSDQVTLTSAAAPIMATPDGVFLFNDGAQAAEFKSIDPRTNKSNLPRSRHVTQLKVAMALLAEHHDYDFTERGGLLYYTDASNFDDVQVFEVDYDSGILRKHKRRAERILRAQSAARMDREGKSTGECRYCPFRAPCGVEEEVTSQSPTRRANRGSFLDSYVTSYVEAKAAEERAKAELTRLKESITRELQARRTSEVVIANQLVKLSQQPGRKTLDKKAVAAAGIDLSPYEKVGRPFTVLTIKPAA